MLSNVLRPIRTVLPAVTLRKIFMSSGNFQGKPPSHPMTPFSPAAKIQETFIPSFSKNVQSQEVVEGTHSVLSRFVDSQVFWQTSNDRRQTCPFSPTGGNPPQLWEPNLSRQTLANWHSVTQSDFSWLKDGSGAWNASASERTFQSLKN